MKGLDESPRITKVSWVHPLETMNICIVKLIHML